MKFKLEMRNIMGREKGRINSIAVKAIANKALSIFGVSIISHSDIANDIFDQVKELRGTATATAEATEQRIKEVILQQYMKFYKFMGWADYRLDTAIRTAYMARLRSGYFNDYNIALVITYFQNYMNRRITLFMPSHINIDSGPPGPVPDNPRPPTVRGLLEFDEPGAESMTIEQGILQMMNEPGGDFILYPQVLDPYGSSGQPPTPGVLPEGEGDTEYNPPFSSRFEKKLIPSLERLIDLHFSQAFQNK